MATATTVTRSADANWKGDVQSGHGILNTQSGVLSEERFSLGCRLDEGDRSETNPEELIAAAAASCFSMALSKTLSDQDKVPASLVVASSVDLSIEDGGPRLSKLTLTCEGTVPAATESDFYDAVEKTKETCPVYLLLKDGFKEVEVNSSFRS